MSNFTKLTTSFVLALLFFMTLALVLPSPKRATLGNEAVISKSALMGYSKYLDNYYYHLGSLIIPIVAFVLWQIQKRLSSIFGLGVLSVWLVGLFWLILRGG